MVAVADENGRCIFVGGGRYLVLGPEKAEIAFAVVDQYRGQGVGTALMRHLVAIGREAGLKELIAEVLPDNIAMLKVFVRSGLHLTTKRASQIVHVALQLC